MKTRKLYTSKSNEVDDYGQGKLDISDTEIEKRDGWVGSSLEVNVLDDYNTFHVIERYEEYSIMTFRAKTDEESVEKIVRFVASIDGYDTDMLRFAVDTAFPDLRSLEPAIEILF